MKVYFVTAMSEHAQDLSLSKKGVVTRLLSYIYGVNLNF